MSLSKILKNLKDPRYQKDIEKRFDELAEKYRPKVIEVRNENGLTINVYEAR